MAIILFVVPLVLMGGVGGALAFASQETEDMSPSEQTKRLNVEAAERLKKDEELRKKLVDADVSREMYREENGLVKPED
eukprot:CAMPEP_0184309142 /NCGR_PEP_ID=MMETSP1049-20130417/17399_1 /TAXON_ID=77928 /ORGANISM="Proteomonas sulcata, Strain CCMP704" /LENGTH=78 /DNA_ID=CAMNT_0026621977 /DNA_START=481 /DNA_END=717 /DNA_ORIENTATION=-